MIDEVRHTTNKCIEQCSRSVEYAELGGEAFEPWDEDIYYSSYYDDENCPNFNPYDILIHELEQAIKSAKSLRDHIHQYVVSDETDRTYCEICGADGDA